MNGDSPAPSPDEFDHDHVVAHRFPESVFSYTERDAAIYALGIGACGQDAVEPCELKFVYHKNGQRHIQVLPTFSTVFVPGSLLTDFHLPGLEYDPQLLLHGQQYIEIYKPLPARATVKNRMSLAGLHDKGKAAVVEIEVTSFDEKSDELLCMNRFTIYLRGAGGFVKSSHPYSFSKYSTKKAAVVKIPKGPPSFVFEDCTQMSQALLYRLSGDYNPLHSDPETAKTAGFQRPILHGLCTLGFAVRAIIRCVAHGDANMIKSISSRFLLHVFPGETLITEMWLEGLRVIYQTKVKERCQTVLSGYVDCHPTPSLL